MGGAMTTQIVPVLNPKDQYYYAYTNGHHNQGRQPELIAMDLDATARGGGVQSAAQMVQKISDQFLGGQLELELGHVHKAELGNGCYCWLQSIPIDESLLETPEAVEATRQGILPLLGTVQAASKIIVLEVDYNADQPTELSKAEAKEYLGVLSKNALHAGDIYARGGKLADG